MASEGLSTDVLVAVAIEASHPDITAQYEGLSGRDRAEQIALDALEQHVYATDRAERHALYIIEQVETLLIKQEVNAAVAQIPRE